MLRDHGRPHGVTSKTAVFAMNSVWHALITFVFVNSPTHPRAAIARILNVSELAACLLYLSCGPGKFDEIWSARGQHGFQYT